MYNPFDKAIGSELDEGDLHSLIKNKVSEGFFVEYKEFFPSSKKIAHGIAALANTYGGWFIVGIKTNEQSEAEETTGYEPESCADPAELIRNSCRDNLDPYPVFRHSIIRLKNGKNVSVTWVPPSDETPHIAKDGRVYVRKGDAKEPVKVETKYQLEVVSERGKKAISNFSKFSQVDDLVLESGRAALQLSISPRPAVEFEAPIFWTSIDFERLKKLFSSSTPIDFMDNIDGLSGTTDMPFNSFHRSGSMIVIEQGEYRHGYFNLSFEMDLRGKCKIILPVNSKKIRDFLSEGEISKEVRKFLTSQDISQDYPVFFDSPKVINIIMHLCRLYLIMIGDERAPGGFRYVMEAVNMHGHSPFADGCRWIDHVDNFGFPVIKKRKIRVPFHEDESVIVDDDHQLIESVRYTLLSLLGLPVDLSIETFLDSLIAKAEGNS